MADSLKTLKCPACGKDMEKVFIPAEGINLDICTQGCGGIYFDNREFKEFDEKNEDISAILEKISNKSFEKVDTTVNRFCPNCGAKMVKNHSSAQKIIEVDDCYNCGGKFLDNNELIKIRAEYDTEEQRSEDVMQYLYHQVGQDLAKLEQRHSEIRPNSLMRNIFYKLTGL